MEKFILDANLFFNMEAGADLGKKTNEVILKVVDYGKKLKNKAEFLMPPGAADEVLSFFENKNTPETKQLFSIVTIRSPAKNRLNFPAEIFYRLVDDVRNRGYRGLALGEEEIVKAGKEMMAEPTLSKMEFEKKIGPVIKNFRLRYRQATRTGFLDSVTDLDLIVLAAEVNGFLVSADEGVVLWGRVFGIKEVSLPVFAQKLDSLLDHRG